MPFQEKKLSNRRSEAAVLLLATDETRSRILFTERPDGAALHPGEICFPGGKIEAGDVSPLAGALRETEEEVGLKRETISIEGRLDSLRSKSGYLVHPFHGKIPPDVALDCNPEEVKSAFTIPRERLLSATPECRRPSPSFPTFRNDGKIIWGLTAKILVQFLRRFNNNA